MKTPSAKPKPLLWLVLVVVLAMGLGGWLAWRAESRAPVAPATVAQSPSPALPPVEEPPLPVTDADLRDFHATASAPPAPSAPPPTTVDPLPVPATDTVSPPLKADEPVADNTAEVAATERMYLAHVSLRSPEVADPDSEANRRILQSMVQKALQTPATAPAK